MRQRAFIATLIPLVLTAVACGDDSNYDAGGVAAVEAGESFPAERCAANEAAGPIKYLTGFDFAAAASILEVVVAESRGYYEDLCLDVELAPSFSTANYPLVASNQAAGTINYYTGFD